MDARSITVVNSTPSGNKLVDILYKMSMKSVSKSNGTLVVKSQLFKLVECMFCVTHSTNAQENGVKSYDFRTNKEKEEKKKTGLVGIWRVTRVTREKRPQSRRLTASRRVTASLAEHKQCQNQD
eukprot:1154839-Pelagomonas_calceolata.AAC.1